MFTYANTQGCLYICSNCKTRKLKDLLNNKLRIHFTNMFIAISSQIIKMDLFPDFTDGARLRRNKIIALNGHMYYQRLHISLRSYNSIRKCLMNEGFIIIYIFKIKNVSKFFYSFIFIFFIHS